MSAPLNLYRLQNFCAHALLCTERLASVNIVTRDELLQPEAQARLPDKTLAAEVLGYITIRNGRKGACVIVETPEITGKYPSAPGQTGDIEIEFLILEDPMMNSAATSGTLVHADVIGEIILDVGKHWVVDGYGIFTHPPNAWRRADEWSPVRAIRVRLRTTAPLGQSNRVEPVSVTIADGAATLACATTDAEIYYTLDETFPGRSNPAAILFSAPVAVESGDTLLAAAYLPGGALNLSRITREIIP